MLAFVSGFTPGGAVEVHDRTVHIEVVVIVATATIVHPPVLTIEGEMGLVLARLDIAAVGDIVSAIL